ncbi:MAG: hypothetical protein EOO06_02005 [Chitinophagaceae bacterium]|nr:MAG: hypothetical protein EOO06_02005 [Chitinophagaceae bacterium]
MATQLISTAVNPVYTQSVTRTSFITRFMTWCGTQESSRLLWLAVILGVHGCILSPITMLLSLQAGAGSYLYVPVIVAMAINLVPNLAALSTKITIPVFLLSVIIDLAIIIAVFA